MQKRGALDMERILSEEELCDFFDYKSEMKKSMDKRSYYLWEIEKIIQKKFPRFSYCNLNEENELIDLTFTCNGYIENNPKELICPKCSSKYVALLCDGDLYYRLFNDNEETKERKKFENSQLFVNRAPVCGYFETSNKCLGCGYEW